MQNVDNSNSSFTDFLSSKMIQYRLDSSVNSYSKIERYSGFNYRTLKKIETYQVEVKRLDPVKVVRLIKLINKESSLSEVIQKYQSNINFNLTGISELRTTLSSYDQYESVNIDLEAQLNTFEKFKLYSLACNHNGTTKQQIQATCNEESLLALNELLEKNILIEKSGKIRNNTAKSYTNFSKKTIKENYKKLFGEIDIESIDFRHFLSGLTQSFNQEGITKVIKILTRGYAEIAAISNDEKYFGNRPYHLTLGFGSYIKCKENLLDEHNSNNSNEVIQ